MRGDGKTILHAGYGKYYDRTLYNDILDEKFRLQYKVTTFWFSPDGGPMDGRPAIKLPSVTGSCSHPTGTGLGALMFGPAAMAPIGAVVLLFQALLLAHGGLTTLGANVFSMAVVGPFVAYAVFQMLRRMKAGFSLSVFAAAALADLATYLTTAFQLALAFPDPAGGFAASFAKFAGIFGLTQVPLAISEGLLTVLVINAVLRFNPAEMRALLGAGKDEVRA